jgi:hypothetical protein
VSGNGVLAETRYVNLCLTWGYGSAANFGHRHGDGAQQKLDREHGLRRVCSRDLQAKPSQRVANLHTKPGTGCCGTCFRQQPDLLLRHYFDHQSQWIGQSAEDALASRSRKSTSELSRQTVMLYKGVLLAVVPPTPSPVTCSSLPRLPRHSSTCLASLDSVTAYLDRHPPFDSLI